MEIVLGWVLTLVVSVSERLLRAMDRALTRLATAAMSFTLMLIVLHFAFPAHSRSVPSLAPSPPATSAPDPRYPAPVVMPGHTY